MTRRRYRALPTPSATGGFNIGVTLAPLGADQLGNGGRGQPTGPVVIDGGAGGGYPCAWLVFMRGVSSLDVIEWVLEWAGMDGDFAGSVLFAVADENASQPMIAQIVLSASGSIEWIDISAIVNGVTYGPERVSCVE